MKPRGLIFFGRKRASDESIRDESGQIHLLNIWEDNNTLFSVDLFFISFSGVVMKVAVLVD